MESSSLNKPSTIGVRARFAKGLVTFLKPLLRMFTDLHVFIYQVSRGNLASSLFGGADVCLLTVEGRYSKELHTVPLVYIQDREDVILVASKSGMDEDPQWYKNILENPHVDIQVGKKLRQMVARKVDRKGKDSLWPVVVNNHAAFDRYQARTHRDIPILVCTPVQLGPSNPAKIKQALAKKDNVPTLTDTI